MPTELTLWVDDVQGWLTTPTTSIKSWLSKILNFIHKLESIGIQKFYGISGEDSKGGNEIKKTGDGQIWSQKKKRFLWRRKKRIKDIYIQF